MKTVSTDFFQLLKQYGGYYDCPKDEKGVRRGFLVGYAAKYKAPDGSQKQFVGDTYANCAVLEQYPKELDSLTNMLAAKIEQRFVGINNLVFVGPQMGGVSVGLFLARNFHPLGTNGIFVCAEKKVTQLATAELREQSELVFARHIFPKGLKAVVAEDVLNNFSTTNLIIDLVEKHGGEVIGISGLLNRSLTITDTYTYGNRTIPVISLVQKPIPEYTQEDPEVAQDIEKGNVILKPKNEWDRLMSCM